MVYWAKLCSLAKGLNFCQKSLIFHISIWLYIISLASWWSITIQNFLDVGSILEWIQCVWKYHHSRAFRLRSRTSQIQIIYTCTSATQSMLTVQEKTLVFYWQRWWQYFEYFLNWPNWFLLLCFSLNQEILEGFRHSDACPYTITFQSDK